MDTPYQDVIRNKLKSWLAVFDGPLALIVFLIMSVGIVTLYSAGIDFPGRVEDQLRNILIGFAIMWIAASVPPQTLMRFAVPIYTFGIALLLAVAMFGLIKKGARRWLNIGIVIQPSEIMKIALPLMLAWFFQKREGHIGWKEYLIAMGILAIPAGLIMKQPDLGTALLVAATGFYVIFLAGLAWKVIIAMFVAGAASLPIVWTLLHDYQRHRVMMLIDPSSDPLGKGFHIIQSVIAIGSGGITGKGWLQGTQAYLHFIPERTTDFIFVGFFRGVRTDRQYRSDHSVSAFDRARADDCDECLDRFRQTACRGYYHDVFHVCLRQYGHGQRHFAGCRRAPAVHELWRDGDGDAGTRHRHFDEYPAASQAGADLNRPAFPVALPSSDTRSAVCRPCRMKENGKLGYTLSG